MNRELRRMSEKGEERARKRRQERGPRPRRQRVGFKQFFREVRQELKKVAWPSREQTVTFSIVVLITTSVITAVTFGLDIAFKWGVLRLLQQV